MRNNWGNCLVIRHGEGLHSLLAHLARGSVRVRVGQPVRRGEEVALCGSSGRSPVPHLHAHFQAGPAVGAPTIPGEFHDIARGDSAMPSPIGVHVPAIGERVFNPGINPLVRDALSLAAGSIMVFDIARDGAPAGTERLRSEVGPWGERLLRSLDRGAVLALDDSAPTFALLELDGGHDSLLRPISLALSRVPYCIDAGSKWTDRLPARSWRHPAWNWFADLGAPFVCPGWRAIAFEAARTGGILRISGRDDGARDRGYRSQATLDPARGLTGVRVTAGGHTIEGVLRDAR
jgi:hypothetical protein